MGILTCICGKNCTGGPIAVSVDMHSFIKCARLTYTAHGVCITRFNGSFILELAKRKPIIVHERFVDLLLFWYANINNGTYDVCIGGRDESIIYVSDDKIYFSEQFVKPIVPFNVVPDHEFGGFIMRLGDNDCRMINVVALSLAMNGAHLLY